MAIFMGPNQARLNGHKDLTKHVDVVGVEATEKVYIPLVNMNSTQFEIHVQEGDQVKIGTKLATRNDNFIVPVFSSVSGVVGKVVNVMHAALKPMPHLEIINDGKNERVRSFAPIDYEKATREELIAFTKDAGIVGCGGAGFPTYFKYQTAKNVESVLINGVECEPYITADYMLMKQYTKELVVGAKVMRKMADAKEAVIAIKSYNKDVIDLVKEQLQGSSDVRVVEVPDAYPMGWERTLVYQVYGKRYDRLPGEIGLVVNNATTAIALASALMHGTAIVEKIVTFSGDALVKTANVQVPVGVRVADVVKQLGGYAKEDVLLIAGGPMMGKTIVNDQFVITTYTNAITVLETKPIDDVACLRCGRCTDHCPAYIQPVRIRQAEAANSIEAMMAQDVMKCIECGLCTYVCPSKLDVTESVRRAKRRVMAFTAK